MTAPLPVEVNNLKSDLKSSVAVLDFDNLEIDPRADLFNRMQGAEFDAFAIDIRDRGILEPIALLNGKILDGRNRYAAAKEVGYKLTDRDFRHLPANTDAERYVFSANMHRRHLDQKAKEALIIRMLKASPDATDRGLARLLGVDHKTVADKRRKIAAELEAFSRAWLDLSPSQRQAFASAHAEELQTLVTNPL
jgi:ParB-like chromosome segregation protein Spo0J